MKRIRYRLILPVLAIAAVLSGVLLPSAANAATGTVCAATSSNLNISGWFVVDTTWQPASCPPVGDGVTPNTYSLRSWYDLQLGDQMWICTNQNFPEGVGFSHVAYTTNDFTCANHNAGISNADDMELVQRTSVGTPSIEPGGIVDPATNSPNTIQRGGFIVIYGINFYPNDRVYVAGQPATVEFDSLASGQINVLLPSSVSGSASVVVQNAFGSLSAPSTIFIH